MHIHEYQPSYFAFTIYSVSSTNFFIVIKHDINHHVVHLR